jgi:transcriptional regulator with XRE-family HTH domain
MSDFCRLFAASIRRLRQASGKTQEEFGAELGLDRNDISRLETLGLNISLEKAQVIARQFGTTVWEMLGDATPDGGPTMGAPFESRILTLRALKKLNKRQVAQKMGVERNTVTDIESGKRRTSLKTLERFCVGLEVTPYELLCESKIEREAREMSPGLFLTRSDNPK